VKFYLPAIKNKAKETQEEIRLCPKAGKKPRLKQYANWLKYKKQQQVLCCG